MGFWPWVWRREVYLWLTKLWVGNWRCGEWLCLLKVGCCSSLWLACANQFGECQPKLVPLLFGSLIQKTNNVQSTASNINDFLGYYVTSNIFYPVIANYHNLPGWSYPHGEISNFSKAPVISNWIQHLLSWALSVYRRPQLSDHAWNYSASFHFKFLTTWWRYLCSDLIAR